MNWKDTKNINTSTAIVNLEVVTLIKQWLQWHILIS